MLTLTEEQLAKIQERIAKGQKPQLVCRMTDQKSIATSEKAKASGKKRHLPGREPVGEAQRIEVTLPWPPSVNTYWRHPTTGPLAGRHMISEKGRLYRAMVKEFAWNLPIVRGHCSVMITAYPPDRRQRDLDNLLKSLIDSIAHAALIENDYLIDDLRITRKENRPNGSVQLVITSA
jgi:crossover junction endodeoxyribonuclease RusA